MNVATHPNPIRREDADFMIFAHLETEKSDARWEQLWARRLGEDRFEICCIPFFAYDLALGDIVETRSVNAKQYVISRVTKPSGHLSFRVWFGHEPDQNIKDEVVSAAGKLRCDVEWSSPSLAAIDAPSEEIGQSLADILAGWERSHRLTYETGRTS